MTYRQKTVMYEPWGFNLGGSNVFGDYAPNQVFEFTDTVDRQYITGTTAGNGNGQWMNATASTKAVMCNNVTLPGGIEGETETKSFNTTTNEWTEEAYCNEHACHDLDEAEGDSSKTCLQGVTCKKVDQKILDAPASGELNRDNDNFVDALDGTDGTDAWLNSCLGHAKDASNNEITTCDETGDDENSTKLNGNGAECNLNCHHCTDDNCKRYAAESLAGKSFERVRVTHIQDGLTNTGAINEHRFHCSIADRYGSHSDCRCRCNKHRKCCARHNYILADSSTVGMSDRHEGSNYIAGNIYENFGKDHQECCNLCINHPDCKAWEWILLDTGNKVCALKNTKEELVSKETSEANSARNYITCNVSEYAKPDSLAPGTTIVESYAGRLNVLGDPDYGVRHDNCTATETA
jgi:hypothetical protein